MNERTDYSALAEKIDYARLEKRLEQLRQQEPPKRRKTVSDLLASVRDKLLELHANGWTYQRLVEELNESGVPVKVGTLREYLRSGGRAAKRRPQRARRTRRTASTTSGGH